MVSTRRNFMEIAAWGAACFPAIAETAAAQDYLARPGDGGFAREAKALPPGGAVAYHDPKDIAAMPEFRFALDAEKPRVASGGWVKEVSARQLPISRAIAGVHAFLNPGAARIALARQRGGMGHRARRTLPDGGDRPVRRERDQ